MTGYQARAVAFGSAVGSVLGILIGVGIFLINQRQAKKDCDQPDFILRVLGTTIEE